VTKNTWEHGAIMISVATLLKTYAKSHAGWSVSGGDPGTKLAKEPATLRGPDVAMVRADRVPKGKGAAGWLDGAPDLAVEVKGDDQSVAELMRKALEYIKAGARQVWLLDPGDLLPGFQCRVAELFE
jgi:Uma2 family endonuclease